MGRGWFGLVFAGLLGCDDVSWMGEVDSDAPTEILVVIPPGTSPSVLVRDRSRSFAIPLELLEDDNEIHALLYAEPAVTLGLIDERDDNEIMLEPLEATGTSGRALPIPSAAFRTMIRGSAPEPWRPKTDPLADLDSIRLPALDPEVCLDNGLCAHATDDLCAPCLMVEPAPPQPPARPVVDCPEDWTRTSLHESLGLETCTPPRSDQSDCGPHEMRRWGEEACRPIGAPCPEGPWPEGLPADRPVLYVDDDAPGPGDGSLADPFRTILRATRNATAGTIIAVAKGTYERAAALLGLEIWGACASETTLFSKTAGTILNVERASSNRLRNLSLEGRSPFVFIGDPMGRLELEGVVILSDAGTSSAAISISNAGHLEAHDVAIRGAPTGINAVSGASMRFSSVLIQNSPNAGLRIDGARLEADGLIIENTSPSVPEGLALLVDRSGEASIRALVIRNQDIGMRVGRGGTAHVSEVHLADSLRWHAAIRNDGSQLILEHVRAEGSGVEDPSFIIEDAGHFEVRSAFFEVGPGVGIRSGRGAESTGSPPRLRLEDTIVARAGNATNRDTALIEQGEAGLELTRVHLMGANRSLRAESENPPSVGEARLEDLTIVSAPESDPCVEACTDLAAIVLATSIPHVFRRVEIHGGAGYGIRHADGAHRFEDLRIEGSEWPSIVSFGAATPHAGTRTLELERLAVERAGGSAIYVSGATDVGIRDADLAESRTLPDHAPRLVQSCPGARAGLCLIQRALSEVGPVATIVRLSSTENGVGIGAQTLEPLEVSISHSRIANNEIGLFVAGSAATGEKAKLLRGVDYQDNVRRVVLTTEAME